MSGSGRGCSPHLGAAAETATTRGCTWHPGARLDLPVHQLAWRLNPAPFVTLDEAVLTGIHLTVRTGEGSSVRRTHIGLRATVDERISEGIYFAHAAALFQRYVMKPELLEGAPKLPASS